MNKKAFLQMSFAWIFAIIAGMVILSLAIYGVTKIIGAGQTAQNLKSGKQIGFLLNPLETGFEVGKTTSLTLPVETRIYNRCNNEGVFGRQLLELSQKNFGKWSKTEIDGSKNVGFSNKYIFSENFTEGKKFYIFSKPFKFPFKVADLIYITSSEKEYCFMDTPDNIKDELKGLNQKNLFYSNCSQKEKIIHVCFDSESECEIEVDYNDESGEVIKNYKRMYFETDALMYAAIFSEKDIYECQLKRLMQRVGTLSELYSEKASIISQKAGCNTNLNLAMLYNRAENFNNSIELNSVKFIANDIEEQNKDNRDCRLW